MDTSISSQIATAKNSPLRFNKKIILMKNVLQVEQAKKNIYANNFC